MAITTRNYSPNIIKDYFLVEFVLNMKSFVEEKLERGRQRQHIPARIYPPTVNLYSKEKRL